MVKSSLVGVMLALCSAVSLVSAQDFIASPLEFDISGPDAGIGKLEDYVGDKLEVIDAGVPVPDDGVDCIRFGKAKATRVIYQCSPTAAVYKVVTEAYYWMAVPNEQPIPSASLEVALAQQVSSCSIFGCKNVDHSGAQPCAFVYDSILRRSVCRHKPYSSLHNCK